METDNLVIDESNFKDYFFDVRLNKPQKGQIMASFTAVGEFCDGPEKRQIIEFLRNSSNIESAMQIMQRVLAAKETDGYRVLREITEDLLAGMSTNEVAQKPYKFVFELCFWTKPEYIPTNDPHWACVSILNMDEHFAKSELLDKGQGIEIKARLVQDAEKSQNSQTENEEASGKTKDQEGEKTDNEQS